MSSFVSTGVHRPFQIAFDPFLFATVCDLCGQTLLVSNFLTTQAFYIDECRGYHTFLMVDWYDASGDA